jgi:hypothetical protein
MGMTRQLRFGLALGLIAALSACAPSKPTIDQGVEATNAAAKQAWQQPRAPQTVDELRNRAMHQADS